MDCAGREAFIDRLRRMPWNIGSRARGTMDAIFAGADFSATGRDGDASEVLAALVGKRSREDDGGCGDGDALVKGR